MVQLVENEFVEACHGGLHYVCMYVCMYMCVCTVCCFCCGKKHDTRGYTLVDSEKRSTLFLRNRKKCDRRVLPTLTTNHNQSNCDYLVLAMKVVSFRSFLPLLALSVQAALDDSFYACHGTQEVAEGKGFGEPGSGSPTTLVLNLYHMNQDVHLLDVSEMKLISDNTTWATQVLSLDCHSNSCHTQVAVDDGWDGMVVSTTTMLTGNVTVQEATKLKGTNKNNYTYSVPFSIPLNAGSDLCDQKQEEDFEMNLAKGILVIVVLAVIVLACCYMATFKKQSFS